MNPVSDLLHDLAQVQRHGSDRPRHLSELVGALQVFVFDFPGDVSLGHRRDVADRRRQRSGDAARYSRPQEQRDADREQRQQAHGKRYAASVAADTSFDFRDARLLPFQVVLKGLVDTVSIDWDPAGGVDGVASKKVGKNILLSMRVHTGTDKRYAATFAFRISDRLSLNGLWRRQDSSTDTTQSQVIDIYESKLRYRVPLN